MLKVIRACKPKVVCFIGKIAFNKFYGSRKCEWGWHVGINDIRRVYLMHFPDPGPSGNSGKRTTRSEGGE